MKRIDTTLDGVFLLDPSVFQDTRGYFTESYNQRRLQSVGIDVTFVQDNESLSTLPGTIRGLHYQLNPMAQSKLVRVLSGAIYDVVVDLRRDSVTYGQWLSFVLTADSHRQLFIPKGFAHGFCTLVPDTTIAYKVDAFYSPQHDRGILWRDPYLAIDWPVTSPLLSDKDQGYPLFHDAEHDF